MPQLFSQLPRRYTAAAVIMLPLMLCGCVSKLFSAEQAPEAAPAGVTQRVQQSKLFGVLPVYRPDTQQGNFISKEQVAQLQVGMTPAQVRFLLGTPLLNDVFHPDRWDYPFLLKRGDGTVTTSHVAVHFKEGRVSHFDGAELPNEKEYLQLIAAPKK
ncbi:MAG: outer membrane protein assembly factor BamE [Betaproteobacteria bacterium]